MSFETERYVNNRVDRIEALEYEVKVLRMALAQHGQLIERLNEAENVIKAQVTNSANEYKKKYGIDQVEFEPCGKCLCRCTCEEEDEWDK